jgi:FkbM family methyltransferase
MTLKSIARRLLGGPPGQSNDASSGESRFRDLGWSLTEADGKTRVGGLDFTFDNVAHAHLIRHIELVARLVGDLGATLAQLPDGRIEFRIGQVRIVPETPQELGILVEIFRDGIYRVEAAKPMFVWDVGANVAAASLYFAGVSGWDVAAYELFPQTAEMAKDNVARSGLANKIMLTAAGVGSKDESLSLPYYPDSRGSNGLYGNDYAPQGSDRSEVQVQVLDAASVIDSVVKTAAGRPILAKLDCEGAEYDILDRLAEAQKLRVITAIVMELHAVPGRDPKIAIQLLLNNGFLVRRARHTADDLSIVYATRLPD